MTRAGGAGDRALGALLGLAVGDALGMPTQLLSRGEVRDRFGPVVTGFVAAAPDHPIAGGLPAGSVTDDTEQALLLARALVAGRGRVDPVGWARALTAWEADLVRRGSADLLGPSTRAALAAIAEGTPPEEAGARGDTNGAAMRIAPVGVATRPGPRLASAVAEVSRVTHGTDVALAGATAVAAAVSTGVAGGDVDAALEAGIAAAPQGAALGRPTGAPALAPLLTRAVDLGRDLRQAAAADDLGAVADTVAAETGSGLAVTESVPAAVAVLAALPGDPWAASRVAASLGDDSDTVAAMVGAVAGACHGADALPRHAVRTVLAVNHLDAATLATLAGELLALRGEPR